MLNISDIQLKDLYTHYVGNASAGDHLEISRNGVSLDNEQVRLALTQFYLSPLKEGAAYNFFHPSDISLNDVRTFVQVIFKFQSELGHQSANIARHLYDVTNLPSIKSGELHVAYFTNVPVNGSLVDAVGIYKTESRNKYLKLTGDKDGYEFSQDEGFDLLKIDKGCIILNDGSEGYRVHIIQRKASGIDSQFWKDVFLRVKPASDNYHATEDHMRLCKEYIKHGMPAEFEVDATQQIELLNKSAAYFKQNDEFEKESFEQQVFNNPELIKSFERYKEQYETERDVKIPDTFDVSDEAFKKNAKSLKQVLKLDKNFHIYIHGDRDRIERGYDAATGMNFYKVYFEEEA